MYRVNVVALLPELVRPVCEYGVVGRAGSNGLVRVDFTNPRDFAHDRHRVRNPQRAQSNVAGSAFGRSTEILNTGRFTYG